MCDIRVENDWLPMALNFEESHKMSGIKKVATSALPQPSHRNHGGALWNPPCLLLFPSVFYLTFRVKHSCLKLLMIAEKKWWNYSSHGIEHFWKAGPWDRWINVPFEKLGPYTWNVIVYPRPMPKQSKTKKTARCEAWGSYLRLLRDLMSHFTNQSLF